jgi:hypothetical protein
MTRLNAILSFKKQYPRVPKCVIVAEHRGSYTAVLVNSDEHKAFAANANNLCIIVNVRKYYREQLELAGYIQPKREMHRVKNDSVDSKDQC